MQLQLPDDERFPAWKIAALQYLIAAFFVALTSGYWHLQVAQHRQFLEQAERNRIRNLPVIAPRGRILDREGRVLADSFPAFTILMMREGPLDLTPERIEGLATGIELRPEHVEQVVQRAEKLPPFQPIVLKQSATLADIAFVESHRMEYPELDLIQVAQRAYPKRSIAGPLLGYVGEVSDEEIARSGSRYRAGDFVGKSGVERTYNEILMGRDGMRRVVVDSRGREVGSMTKVNAQAGTDLRLTIDFDVQLAAEAGLGGQPGGVVALDPRTGEVLALASHPSFDPNVFAGRIDRETWEQLLSNPMKPLLNKTIQSHLAPGSVFKVITAAAALETGAVTPEHSVYCPGYVTIYGHTFRDWTWKKGHGHGYVDLHRAIVVSCDVYFYLAGQSLGIEKLAFFAKKLGLGQRTGIDLPSEEPGLVPSPEWAQRVHKRKWYAGETISVAIGQGAVAATPLQLAYAIGGIASGGVFRRPHVTFREQLRVRGVKTVEETARDFPLRPETVEVLTNGMWGVVHEDGTATAARHPLVEISGKTGTAQVVSMAAMQASKKLEFQSNAWFVGFAPRDKPEIVVAVLVMHGNTSAVAVPIAREVIRTYFEKKAHRRLRPEEIQTQVRVLGAVTTPGGEGLAPGTR
jgi:penicillin-binding protein 2